MRELGFAMTSWKVPQMQPQTLSISVFMNDGSTQLWNYERAII